MNCPGPVTCASYTVSGGGISSIAVAPLWGAVLSKAAAALQGSPDRGRRRPGPGRRTAVVATVTDIGGQPVADGTVVNFPKLRGAAA